MGTVPVPYTWVNGEEPDFRDMENRLAKVIDYAMNPPFVRLRKTTQQSIASSTVTTISWNFVEVETENMWDAALPTRIKPSTPGWYVGTTGISFDANATGYREIDIKKNGHASDRILRIKFPAFTGGQTTVSRGNMFLEQFNGTTDYVELTAWQNSGSTILTLADNLQYQPDMVLRWVAPL